ncbi:unnamed protein product [Mucor hiemalis]
MGDRPHLSNEQELFYTYGHSNESIATTSSTSSPVNSIAQSNFGGFNWHGQAASAAINFDSGVNHSHFDYSSQRHLWSSPQPQQHHYMIQQQQQHTQFQHQIIHQQRQYHQNMSYRSPLIMQGSPYEDPYRDYPMDNNELMRYNTPHLTTDTNQHTLHKTDTYHQQHNTTTLIPMADMSTNTYYPLQYIPPDKIINTSNEDELPVNKSYNNVKNKSKDLKIIETSPSSSKSKIKYKTPSPKSTTLPSPLIPSITTSKRKRVEGDSRRNSISANSSTQQQRHYKQQQGGGKRSHRQQEVLEEEGGMCNELKEGDVNREAVDQIENELAFLRDECATILIMLDSLRNAFITDVSTSSDLANKSAPLPLTGTINFMENDAGFINNFTNQSFVTKIKPRRSIVMAQNPEMEREMRIAYDDLMLQVRQLEKKVERLEIKSKNACILENLKAKRRKKDDDGEEEQRYSHISNTVTSDTINGSVSGSSCGSSCVSEDEYGLSENEIDDSKLRKKVFSRKGQFK